MCVIVANGRNIETTNWIKHIIPKGIILHLETPNILHTDTHSLLMRMVSKGMKMTYFEIRQLWIMEVSLRKRHFLGKRHLDPVIV